MGYKLYCLDGIRVDYDNFSNGAKFLIELEEPPEVSENIEIQGKVYSVCMLSLRNNQAGLRTINFNDSEEVDETREETFTCPYCNYEYIDAFELSDDGEINCPRCHSKLEYERIITVEYNVFPKKKADIIRL